MSVLLPDIMQGYLDHSQLPRRYYTIWLFLSRFGGGSISSSVSLPGVSTSSSTSLSVSLPLSSSKLPRTKARLLSFSCVFAADGALRLLKKSCNQYQTSPANKRRMDEGETDLHLLLGHKVFPVPNGRFDLAFVPRHDDCVGDYAWIRSDPTVS